MLIIETTNMCQNLMFEIFWCGLRRSGLVGVRVEQYAASGSSTPLEFVKAGQLHPPLPCWPAHSLRRNPLCSTCRLAATFGGRVQTQRRVTTPKLGPKKRSRRRGHSPRSWGSWGESRGFCSLRGQAFPSWPHHSPALAPCKCSRPLPHPALPGKLSPTNSLSSCPPLVSGPPRVGRGPMRGEFTYCGGSGWPCSLQSVRQPPPLQPSPAFAAHS